MQRRRFLQSSLTGLLASQALPFSLSLHAAEGPINTRPIPSSGEALPIVGMGTSRTFDADSSEDSLSNLTAVMQAFFDGGGRLLDSSPMYGQAESRVGDVLSRIPDHPKPFAATKVWTEGRDAGISQMEESARRMGVDKFDLMQIHNLVDWRTHLKTLRDWKEQGKVRYIGITTSHQRYHEEVEAIMKHEPIDFVQFSYNIDNRAAEKRLLPLAGDKGIATLINRPYQRGALFRRVRDKELPPVAKDLGCDSWGQFFLKFIAGHPAVTCLIPASSRPHHMADNVGANFGPLPDERQRAQMLADFEAA